MKRPDGCEDLGVRATVAGRADRSNLEHVGTLRQMITGEAGGSQYRQ
jgi:hypothetical protein